MSAEHIIRWNAKTEKWSVYRTGEFARYVKSFPTLLEAEQWVIEQGEDER